MMNFAGALKEAGKVKKANGEGDVFERSEFKKLAGQAKQLQEEKDAIWAEPESGDEEDEEENGGWDRRKAGDGGGQGGGGRGGGGRAGPVNIIYVSQLNVGKVIGKGGATIRAITAKSGAKIDISRDAVSVFCIQ